MANYAGQATLRLSQATNADAHNFRVQAFSASDPGGNGVAVVASANQPFELAAGQTVTLYTEVRALTGNGGALTVQVAVYDDAATNVLPATTVFQGTSTGVLAAGANVTFTPATAGTFEIFLYSSYQGDTVNGNYTADTDGHYARSGTVITWSSTLTEASKGYVRAGANLTAVTVSNAAPGGTAPTAWAYPDRVYMQATVAQPAELSTSVTTRNTLAAGHAGSLSTGTSTTWSDTAGWGPLDKTDLTSGTSGTVTPQIGPAANAALSGQPAFHFSTLPSGWTAGPAGTLGAGPVTATGPAVTTDVGIRFNSWLQLDDNTFPPPGYNGTTKPVTPPNTDPTHGVTQRLNANLGFVGCYTVNARSEPVGGVSFTRHLQDTKHLVSDVAGDTVTTAASGTGTGFAPSYIGWSSQLPAGAWVHTETITAPSGLVGTEIGATQTVVLLAQNPNYRVILGAGIDDPRLAGDHWHPGLDFLVGVGMLDSRSGQLLTPDSAPTVIVGRLNLATGHAEYLGADYSWHPIAGSAAYKWATQPVANIIAGGDTNVYAVVYPAAQTVNWYPYDIFLQAQMLVNSNPYFGVAECDPAGVTVATARNKHIGAGYGLRLGPLSPRS